MQHSVKHVMLGFREGLSLFVLQGKGGRQAVSSYKFSSVGARFKKQLAELMSALHTMEPHYIRCIKPNSKNRPMDFESTNVLHQLRCGGVLEAVSLPFVVCTANPFSSLS